MRTRFLILAAATLVPFAAASAQSVAGPSNVISIQPIQAVFTIYSAEYERKVASAVTLGIGGTRLDLGDDADNLSWNSGDLKLRYYPQGTALQGFSFGGSVGYTSVSATNPFDGSDEKEAGPSFGILLEYQWLMGSSRNFAVALGLGAKAVMVSEDNITSSDYTARYPTARVSVGFAF